MDGTSLAGRSLYLFCHCIGIYFCDRGFFMIERKSVHFIGIGGTGLSAIARVLLESGYQVTGSDRSLSPLAKSLQAEGVRLTIGHRAENIEGAQVVVRSSAIPDDNVEVKAAREQGIPVLKAERIFIQPDG